MSIIAITSQITKYDCIQNTHLVINAPLQIDSLV